MSGTRSEPGDSDPGARPGAATTPATTEGGEGASEAPPGHRPDRDAGHGAAVELPPGWSRAKPDHIPRPTYWPAVFAVGIGMLLWGVITSLIISAVGLALVVIALTGWIGELRHGE
jgi:hypothetical protein